jgi:predicted dithiol-disulfide oxidoreductase (DUF899 family)
MTTHMTGTREEWLAARRELLKAEKELTRRSDELARQRLELPWVRIDKKYRFETDEGTASLADLFRGRSQLLVYHFMFGPDYTAGCATCSVLADGFNGFAVHLANHDVMTSCFGRRRGRHSRSCRRTSGVSLGLLVRQRLQPGMSAFAQEDGVVYHAYSTYARGLDGLWGMYQWLDRAPKGRDETGVWWRRHGEYDKR